MPLLLLTGLNVSAQKAKPAEAPAEAPYLKQKALPAFDAVYLNGKDTLNTYNIPSGKPILIVYFSPDCDHCKKMLDAFLPQMDRIKNVDVYFMSFMPVIAMQVFNSAYHLDTYPNTRFIGQDFRFFFPAFYGVSAVPDVVLYDKDKNFVKMWPDVVTMDEVVAALPK